MHDDGKRREDLELERQQRRKYREYELQNRELKLQETKMAMDRDKLQIEEEECCSQITANKRMLSTLADLLKQRAYSS